MDAMLAVVKGRNKRAVLALLASRGPMRQIDIARELGVGDSTALVAIGSLKSAGLVRTVDKLGPRGGKRYGIDPDGMRALAAESLALAAVAEQDNRETTGGPAPGPSSGEDAGLAVAEAPG